MSIFRITVAPAIAALLSAGILMACENASIQEAFQIDEQVERVEVFVEKGDVAIWTSSASSVRVERTLVGQPGLHVLETRVDQGTLSLLMSCEVPLGCAVDSSLYIPAGVPVVVEVLDGSLHIDGLPQG